MASSSTLRVLLTAEDQATAKIKALKKETDSLAGVVMRNHRQIGMAMTAFGASVTAAAGLAVKAAAEVEQTKGAFERLAKANGESAEDILKALKESSKGTISANDLMLAANRAMVLGVAKNTDQFTRLMEIARDRSRAMGSTATQAFNDIVTGIGRGSPLILDNLGIIVDLTEANQDYAKAVGKATNQLTEADKQQALLNAVLNQGETSIDRTALATLTTAERFQQLKAQISDTAATLGTALLPIVAKVVGALADVIGKFSAWAEDNKGLAGAITIAGSAVGILAMAIGPLLIMLPSLIKGLAMASARFRTLATSIASIKVASLSNLIVAVNPLVAGIAAVTGGLLYLNNELNKVTKNTENLHSAAYAVEQMTWNLKNLAYTNPKEHASDYLSLVAALKSVGKEAEAAAMAEEALAYVARRLPGDEFFTSALSSYLKTTTQIETIKVANEEWAKYLTSISEGAKTWDSFGISGEEALSVISLMTGKTADELAGLFSEAEIGSDDWREKWEEMATTAGTTGEAFSAAIGDIRSAITGELTTAIDEAAKTLTDYESSLADAIRYQDDAKESVRQWQAEYKRLSDEISGVNELLGLARSPNLEGMAEYEDQIFTLNQQLKELDLSKLTGGISDDAYETQRQALEDSIKQLELMRDIEFDPLIRQLDDSADRIEGLGRYGEISFGALMEGLNGIKDNALPELQAKLEETGVSLQNALDIQEAADQAVAAWQTMVDNQKTSIDDLLDKMNELKTATIESIDSLAAMKKAADEAIAAAAQANAGVTVPGPNQTITLPGFANGGIVPGPIGSPQVAVVHGGERVTPAGSGSGVTVVLQGPMFLGGESDARKLADIIGAELQRKSRGGYALSR